MMAQTNASGGKFYSDFNIYGDGGRVNYSGDVGNGFHNGGHASFEERMEILLRMVPKSKPVTMYMIHTEHPELAAHDAFEYFRERGVNNVTFVGRFDHYDKSDPFNRTGHFINLMESRRKKVSMGS
jgi:hypothetical protein